MINLEDRNQNNRSHISGVSLCEICINVYFRSLEGILRDPIKNDGRGKTHNSYGSIGFYRVQSLNEQWHWEFIEIDLCSKSSCAPILFEEMDLQVIN